MAIALAVRPNLLLLAIAVIGWSAILDWRRWRAMRRVPMRTLRLALGLAPAVAGIAWFNVYLYGSPLVSGYGSLDYLYSPNHVSRNVTQFTTWMLETQTPIVFASLLFFVAPGWMGEARLPAPRILLGGVMLALVASYLFYIPFDHWSYLRFLLPMWPPLMLTTALALDAAARRWRSPSFPAAHLVAAVCVALACWQGVSTAVDRNAFNLWRGEQRYVDVAHYLAAHTDARSVVVSWQHSGSIRHYGDRLTLRWDHLHPAWLDGAAEYLTATGHHPYIVVDVEEVEQFIGRFRPQNRLGALDWTPMAVLGRSRVAIYDAGDRSPRQTDVITDSGRGRAGWRCPMPQRWPMPLRME
jgi:hypothetical protein